MSGVASDVDRAMLWLAARLSERQEAAQDTAAYSSDAWLTSWNPLDDERDAQNLLVAVARSTESNAELQITAGASGFKSVAVSIGNVEYARLPISVDLARTTRRTIVQAAAFAGLRTLPKIEQLGSTEEKFARLGACLRESLERNSPSESALSDASGNPGVATGKTSTAAPDDGSDLEHSLRGKRLYGRGLIGLSSHLIDELFDVARAHGYRLLMLAGDPQWVRQEYLIVHPDDIPLLPRNIGDPYFALSNGQGFAVFPINPKILLQPFNVMRLS